MEIGQIGLILLRFAFAIWLGGGLAVALATRSIFAAAESRRQGGLFSGAVLESFARLRWAAVALTLFAWLLPRGPPVLWATAASALTFVHVAVDRRTAAFRAELGGSTEGLAADDPRRKRWGALHGASVLLLLAQIACAGAGLVRAG